MTEHCDITIQYRNFIIQSWHGAIFCQVNQILGVNDKNTGNCQSEDVCTFVVLIAWPAGWPYLWGSFQFVWNNHPEHFISHMTTTRAHTPPVFPPNSALYHNYGRFSKIYQNSSQFLMREQHSWHVFFVQNLLYSSAYQLLLPDATIRPIYEIISRFKSFNNK